MKDALALLVQNRGWGEFLQPDSCQAGSLSRNPSDAMTQVTSIAAAVADLAGQK